MLHIIIVRNTKRVSHNYIQLSFETLSISIAYFGDETHGRTHSVPIIHLLYALDVIKSKCCGGVWGYRPKLLHAFLSLALDGGHWLISPDGHFTPGKEPPTPRRTHCV